MVDFTRAAGTPAPVKANDKAGDASGNTPMMNYNDATDGGLNQRERLQQMSLATQDNVTMGQSYIAGAKSSILGGLLTKMDAPDFTADPAWNNEDVLSEDPRVKEMRPDEDELKWLKGSSSLDEYQYRWDRIPEVRKQMQQAAANPVSGIAGAVVADAPSMLIPFVQEGAIGRTAATALRIAADTYDVGASLYTAGELGQHGFVNAAVAGTGILDMAFLVARGFGRVATRVADESIDTTAARAEGAAAQDGNRGSTNTDLGADEVAHANNTGVHPDLSAEGKAAASEGKADELIVDPDNPVIPPSTRDLDDDLATFDNMPQRTVAGSDYSALDDISIKTNKATTGAVNSDRRFGAALSEDMPGRPVLSRALERMEELERAGELPADFPKQFRTMVEAVGDNAEDIPFRLDRKTNFRAHYQPGGKDFADGHIRLAFPEGAKGKGPMSASDVIGSMNAKELRTLLHESIHAATARAIIRAERNPALVDPVVSAALQDMKALREHLLKQFKREVKEGKLSKTEQHYIGYYLKNNHELVAGLGDSHGGYTAFLQRQASLSGKESALRQLGKAIMRVLGMKGTERTALTDLADAMEDLMSAGPLGSGKLGKQAISRAAPEFVSDTMKEMTTAARQAIESAPAAGAQGRAADAMYGKFRQGFNRFFSLRDDIARGGAETADFADYLVADGTRIGERTESVADLKRLMKSEMDAVTAQVEKAVTDQLSRNGVGKLQQFFYRKAFVESRRELEQKVAHYLDMAHGEYRAGRAVPPPTADIQPVVDSFVQSGWGERWFDHMQNAGINMEGRFEKSPYYLPRRYSSDRMRALSRQGYEQKDFVDVFSAAMRDTYPAMDRDLSRQVARTWYQGLTSAQPKQGAMWRRAINGMTNDEFVESLVDAGVSRIDAEQILEKSVFASERTGSNPARNLRRRNELDMQKVYTAQSGRTLKLADVLDTDVTKLMNQYNNRMSGRVAFASKGTPDMKDLSNRIDDLRNTLTEDVEGWTNKVDDTIDALMGYPVMGDTADWMLASGYLSNAMMLKNSGLYQLTDLALSAKEFGMARVVRSMFQSGLFKHARVELGNNPDLHQRLSNILTGATQNDMRFRWLHTLADDNTDLTRSAYFTNLARNLSQAAYSANGMRFVHRAMVNMNAGLIQDSIMAALNGSAKDAALLQRFGLRQAALDEMRTAFAANPTAAFRNDLQTHLEAVGQRFMDYVVQQNRTGETSHFAEMNPVGRVLIGYQSFAMAATNKILRRYIDNGEYLGFAMLLAYQFPMMALATYARYGADGKQGDKSSKDLIRDAASGMSAIGGATLIMDLFNPQQRGGGVSMLGGANNVISTLQGVARKGEMSMQDASKLVPLAQEFIPLRILINNTTGE